MATVPPKELLAQWSGEQIPVEMATGHIIQNLVTLQAANEALKQAVSLLQTQIDNLKSAPATKTPQHIRKTTPRK